jgi:alpha-beta hydrolase superfamily lysophospholipase
MFQYFPGNARWSAGLILAIMAGGQLGQIDRWLSPLKDGKPDENDWAKAWDEAGYQQEREAAKDVAKGYLRSASERYFHASTYHLTGERQTPLGAQKTASYQAALTAFSHGVKYMARPIERVEVGSPDGILPGYLIPARDVTGPAPVVIFYNGFDVTKEILFGIIRDEFADRGIHCLVVDTPGTGEPLRLRNVPSRPDYEVPTAAIVDYLETRPDVDASRIGLLGISLGGYYAPRGAAFEHRIKAVVAWGAVWDYGVTWQDRWDAASKTTSVPFFQLPWVMGTNTMEEALERVKQWKLADALPHLTQPFLILHGEHDTGFSMSDAQKQYEAAGSVDKELRVFTIEEGGSEHVNADDPDPARQFIADWFARKLGTENVSAPTDASLVLEPAAG